MFGFHKQKNKSSPKVINPVEQVVEFGKDTAERAVHEVVETFNPLSSIFENPTHKERESGNNNFSELDFDKLNDSYAKQDNSQLESVRNQIKPQKTEERSEEQTAYDYHRREKREEEEFQLKKEQDEEEKKQNEEYEEQQKRQMEQAKAHNQSQESAPKGKKHKSILGDGGHRKSSTELPPEFRPDSGKQ